MNDPAAATLKVETVRTLDAMQAALDVRRAVFIVEQQVPEELEIDEHDVDPAINATAVHVLLRAGGRAVATGRLLLDGHGESNAHIGRVAVVADERGKGLGTAVMRALQDEARSRGFRAVTLAAQLHAIGFYERLGYVVRGDVFLDAGIEHRWMDLTLA